MVQLSANELINYRKYICNTSSIYFSCILKGTAPGIIWGDRADSPEFLLVFSPYQEGFQLMGQPLGQEKKKAFRNWFYQVIMPFMKEQGIDCFEYGADTKELAAWIRGIFPEQEFFCQKQKIFHKLEAGADLQQPAGYRIEKVDDQFLKKGYLDQEYVFDEINLAYADSDAGLKKAIVYVAIQDNTIVAKAGMLFDNDGYGNISVDTKEAHRRKGLAAYLAKKTVEDAMRLELTPIWDCAEENMASERTAKKCGFRKIREDEIYCFEPE